MVTREMLEKLDHRIQVMFAVFCAKQVISLVDTEYKEVCLKAIEAAEGFVEGKVSKEECFIVADVVINATNAYAANAAGYAANAVAYSFFAAANATNAAAAANAAASAAAENKEAVQLEQIRYYNELLNFDKIVEDILGV